MYFLFILVSVLLGTLLVLVEAHFYIEYTSNLYQKYYGPRLKTLLFDCNTDPTAYHPEGMKPPILCILVRDFVQRHTIYKTNNFFIVRSPKLPVGQSIEFVDVVHRVLPHILYLAIPYEHPNYPDFLLPEVEENQNAEENKDSPNKKMYSFLDMTNVKVFRENSEEFLPPYRAYMDKLKRTHSYYRHTLSPENKISGYFRNWKVGKFRFFEKFCEPTAQDAKDFETPERAAMSASILLTKMIDPCFIATLVNDGTKGKKVSEKEANLHCTTCCQALTVFPLLLKMEQVEQCKDLTVGKCVGNKCMCHRLMPTKRPQTPGSNSPPPCRPKPVSMAECNNRVVTIASWGHIRRFTSSPIGHFPVTSNWLRGWEAYRHFANKIIIIYGRSKGSFKPRDPKAQEYWIHNKEAPPGRKVKFEPKPPEIIPESNEKKD